MLKKTIMTNKLSKAEWERFQRIQDFSERGGGIMAEDKNWLFEVIERLKPEEKEELSPDCMTGDGFMRDGEFHCFYCNRSNLHEHIRIR